MGLLDNLTETVRSVGGFGALGTILGAPEDEGSQPSQPAGQTVGEVLGTSGGSAGTDALMASAAARYVEGIRTRDLKTQPITTDDLAALYTFQNYNKLSGPDRDLIAKQARLDALTSQADQIFNTGTDEEIDQFLSALSMGENAAALDALLAPQAVEDTGMAELLAQQEQQVRMAEIEYERSAFLDFLDVFPQEIRGQFLLQAMESPDIQKLFFPGMVTGSPQTPEDFGTALRKQRTTGVR